VDLATAIETQELRAGSNEFPKVSDALLRKLDVPVPRYTSYPTAPVWTEEIGPGAYASALARAGQKDAPLSLYVHIPFCKERCSFCGCNVAIARNSSTADPYLASLLREMDAVCDLLGSRRSLSQIHWGGGTPTFLDERQIAQLFTAISSRFAILPDAEVAVEIDPKVTSRSQLELLRTLGFNRLSMGVQDLDPAVQDAISRIQTPEETRTPSVLRHAWARLRQPALTPRWADAVLDPRLFELRDRPAANSEFGALIEAGASRSREKRVVP